MGNSRYSGSPQTWASHKDHDFPDPTADWGTRSSLVSKEAAEVGGGDRLGLRQDGEGLGRYSLARLFVCSLSSALRR